MVFNITAVFMLQWSIFFNCTVSQYAFSVNKHGSGTTTLYRFLTKGQQWLWIKTHGTVQYIEGTKQPQSIVCHNIVVSYGEVWQYLQNKAQQYGPKEAKMVLPITDRVVPKTEVTLDGTCVALWDYSLSYCRLYICIILHPFLRVDYVS